MPKYAYNPDLEAMSRDELEKYQWKKLSGQLEFVAGSNRFYRDKWKRAGVGSVRSFQEFCERVPLTRKSELIDDQAALPPFGHRLGVKRDKVVQINLTGGTSGKGQEVHGLTLSDVASTAAMYSWGCFWAGLRAGDQVGEIDGRAGLRNR